MATIMSNKHPAGLFLLSFSEVWERLGFYAIQSIFVLYLTSKLHFSDVRANDLYSAFTTLLYAAPVIGGFLADRILGFRRAIIFGNVIYILGYFLMLSRNQDIFYLAMAFLICGNGFFKPNISSLLGTLYEHNDPRKDSGFTLFYLGINLGTAFGPLLAAFVVTHYGYHYGFACSSIGMVISLINFLLARKTLQHHGTQPLDEQHHNTPKKRPYYLVYIIALIATAALSRVIQFSQIIEFGILAFCIVSVIYSFYYTFKFESTKVRKQMIALFILFASSVIFWSFYMLIYSSITLFVERNVELSFLGINFSPSVHTIFMGFFIILLAPVMAKLWMNLNKKSIHISYATKFALGNILQGLSFAILLVGIFFHGSDYKISYFWIILSALIRVLGELSLSPIGLSVVTELAPSKLVGMMMGIWFLTIAGGVSLGNLFANWAAVPTGITDPRTTLIIYQLSFVKYSVISIGAGVLLLLCTPLFKRLTQE